MTDGELLERLHQDVLEGARALVGAILVKGTMRARIVETEAYRAKDDAASHAFRGYTPRNAVMFGPPGFAYIYFNYGVHWMLNIVAHAEGDAAAVLIRAAEPLEGLEEMRLNRGLQKPADLLSGPGKLTKAFGITKEHNGIDLFAGSEIQIHAPEGPAPRVIAVPRVGIAIGKAHDFPWRFTDADRARWVSKPTPKDPQSTS